MHTVNIAAKQQHTHRVKLSFRYIKDGLMRYLYLPFVLYASICLIPFRKPR